MGKTAVCSACQSAVGDGTAGEIAIQAVETVVLFSDKIHYCSWKYFA
jgi:hypothetical protein